MTRESLSSEAEPKEFRSRTIFEIRGLEDMDDGSKIVRAHVPGWDPYGKEGEMLFSIDLLPEELHEHARPGVTFLAKLNLAARTPEDLKPDNFELAPPPIEESDLE